MLTRMMLILLSVPCWINCSTNSPEGQPTISQWTRQPVKSYGQAGLVNRKTPVFRATTIQGQPVDRSYFRYKATLINFSYIDCQPCSQQAPLLHELFQTIDSATFQILCIAP